MANHKPTWLPAVRELCRGADVTICGWGAETLVVSIGSADRADILLPHLAQLGFRPMEDEDDAAAGLLTLSLNPASYQAKQMSVDVSRRRLDEIVAPLIWLVGSIITMHAGVFSRAPKAWLGIVFGTAFLVLFFWDAGRIWGWKLEILPESLRVRRRFRWSAISWREIRSVQSNPAVGQSQETVTLTLVSDRLVRLGTFSIVFARMLRDRLKGELAMRQSAPN